MMYEELLKEIAYEFGMEFDDLCFSVSTANFDFPFSFFAFETDDFLGILVTDENGAEKLHVIIKDNIEYIKFMYRDDLELLFDVDANTEHRDVNIHE